MTVPELIKLLEETTHSFSGVPYELNLWFGDKKFTHIERISTETGILGTKADFELVE